MLDNWLCRLAVHLFIVKLFKQTHSVWFFTKRHTLFCIISPVKIVDTSIYYIIYCDHFGVNFIISKWFNKKHYVRFSSKINYICFTISPVNIADSMCQPIYCVDLGYIWLLKCGLSQHTVLSVSLILIQVVSLFDQWIR